MRLQSPTLLAAFVVLAGCRFAPLPPTATIPPTYHPIRPAGPERTPTPQQLATAFAERCNELIGVLCEGSEENRAFAREELGRMGRVAAVALEKSAKDEDGEVRAEVALALGATHCEEALPPLLALAQDDDWSVREAAAQALGRLRATSGSDALLALLADDAWRVRLAAIRALGEIGDVRAVPALLPLTKDVDEDVRYAAWLALSRIGDPRGRQALLEGIEAEDPHVRRACAEGLARVGLPADVAALERRVTDESHEVRLAVVQALTRLSDGRLPETARLAVDAWVDALGVPEPSIACSARLSLAQLGAPIVPWLVERVGGAPEAAQVALLQLIMRHPTPDAIDACRAALASPSDVVRSAAIDVLAVIPTTEATDLLFTFATEGNAQLRSKCIVALVARRSERCEEAIVRALSEADPLLRQAAVTAIGQLPEERRLLLLTRALERETTEALRLAIVRGMGSIDSAEARAKLTEVWKANRASEVGAEAISALGRHPSEDHRETLLDALRSDNARAREAALDALVRVPDEGTLAILEEVLSKGNPDLWPTLVRGLATLAPHRAIEEAGKALDAGDRGRRLGAVAALASIATPESVRLLERALRSDEMELSTAALDALLAMPAAIAAPAVLRAASEHRDELVRARAATAFALWGYVGAAPRLRERLAVEEDPNVRCSLIGALGFLQDEPSAPAIAEAARSDDPRMRTQALCVLGLVGTPAAIPPLVEALRDPDPSVRQLAVEALGNLRARDARDPLLERLADPSAEVRRAAVIALATYGEPADAPLLLDAMRGLHPDLEGDEMRLACANELAALGLPELAREEFENVLRSMPHGGPADMEAHLHLAYLLAARRDFEGAAMHARARRMLMQPPAAEVAEADFLYSLLHGVVLLRTGRESNGLAEITAGLEASKRDPMALNNAAYFLAEAGVALDLAARLADEAVERMPDDPNVLDTAGWVAYARGNFKRAREILARAVSKGPTAAEPVYHLARAEMALGDVDAALARLRRAVELQPSCARRAAEDAAFLPLRGDRRFIRIISPAGPR